MYVTFRQTCVTEFVKVVVRAEILPRDLQTQLNYSNIAKVQG